MNNEENKDDGIQIIDLDTSDDGIQIMNADEIEDSHESSSDSADNPATDPIQKASDARMTVIRRIIMGVSAVVFLFSAGMLIYIFMGYHKADRIYNSVESSVFTPIEQTTSARPDSSGDTAPTADGQSIANEAIISGFTYNHEALLEINTDSVGYMVIPALNICLPVVQGSDNEFYLTHAVTGDYSGNGTLFIDYRIEDGLEAPNAIIYGHAMKNGAMFGSLYKFKDSDFFHTGSNDTLYIYCGNNIYTYRIYSVHNTPAVNSTAYTKSFADDASFITYASEMKNQSVVSSDVSVAAGDKTITLSTCTNDDNTRLVVHAVRTAITPQ